MVKPRLIFLSLFLFLLIPFSVRAELPVREEPIEYKVTYGPIHPSASSQIVEKTMVQGQPCYHIVFTVSYGGWFFIQPFDWEFHAYCTIDEMLTLKYEKWITKAETTKHMKIIFDQEKHLAHYLEMTDQPDKTIEILPQTRDWVTVLHLLSAGINFNEIKSGDVIKSASLEEDKYRPYYYELNVDKIERSGMQFGDKSYLGWIISGMSSNLIKGGSGMAESETWLAERGGHYIPIKMRYGSITIEIKKAP